MNGETLQRRVTITNPQGFHMRPAAAFARLALGFQCTVTVSKGERRVNGKSWLDLMTLAADQGEEVVLEVSGSDARTALDPLASILAAPAVDDGPETNSASPTG